MRARLPLTLLAAMLAAAGAFALARLTDGSGPRPAAGPDPIRLDAGVPLGVLETHAGALAAGAEYLASARRTVLTDPAAFGALLARAWTPGARTSDLAIERAALRQTPAGAGLRLLVDVVSGRLLRMGRGAAELELWSAATFWSLQVVPTQTWSLDRVGLLWRGGRWWLEAIAAQPSPVPDWAAGSAAQASSRAFDRALGDMSAPSYGAI
jgi:hypothetical protein